jgi:hypothetical protein
MLRSEEQIEAVATYLAKLSKFLRLILIRLMLPL